MSGTFSGRVAFASCAITSGPPGSLAYTTQSGDFDETAAGAYVGVGQFLLTLASPIDPSEAIYSVTARAALGKTCICKIDTAGTVDGAISVEVLDDGGVAIDPDAIDVLVLVRPAN